MNFNIKKRLPFLIILTIVLIIGVIAITTIEITGNTHDKEYKEWEDSCGGPKIITQEGPYKLGKNYHPNIVFVFVIITFILFFIKLNYAINFLIVVCCTGYFLDFIGLDFILNKNDATGLLACLLALVLIVVMPNPK